MKTVEAENAEQEMSNKNCMGAKRKTMWWKNQQYHSCVLAAAVL